jgi:GYF domain 2
MPEQWIVRVGGKEYGPVDLDTLAEWKREGRLVPSNEIRRDSDSDWTTAATLFAPPPLPRANNHPLARRRSFGEIIRDSFRIYRTAFVPFFLVTLLVAIPAFVFELTSPVYGIFHGGATGTGLTAANIVALLAVVLLVIGWPVFLAAIQIISLEVLEGRPVRVPDVLRRAVNFFPRFARLGLIVYGSYFFWTALPVLAIFSLLSASPSLPVIALVLMLLAIQVMMVARLWVNFLFWQQSAVVSNLDRAGAISESKTLARSGRRAAKPERPLWRGAVLASIWLVLVLGLSSGAEIPFVLSKMQNITTPEQMLALIHNLEAAKTPDAMLIASAILSSLLRALIRPFFGIAFVLLYFDARSDFTDSELAPPEG